MTNPENRKLELPPESAAAIAEVAEEQRAWIFENLAELLSPSEEPADAYEAKRRVNRVRSRVSWLIKTTKFFEKLSQTRDINEMDNLLTFDLDREVDAQFNFKNLPKYKEIVSEALMHCLTQANTTQSLTSSWIRNAIKLKKILGKDMAFNDTEIPGYTDAWKSAFVYAIKNDRDKAMTIAKITEGEVNLREIPNYEELVKEKYYQVMLGRNGRDDQTLRRALGEGIDFAEKEERIVDRVAECLNNRTTINVSDINYLLEKFGSSIHYGPDNIENFEAGVKAAFLVCLTTGQLGVSGAKKIKERLGSGITFDDEVRAGITFNLDQYQDQDHYSIDRAKEIKKEFGQAVVLHEDSECQRAVVDACMRMLKRNCWRTSYIVSLKEELGDSMSFSEQTVPGYAATVQVAFLGKIREGSPSDATTIKKEFGQGVPLDAESLNDYQAAVRDGFVELISKEHIERAKDLLRKFEKGAEIKDKATIVQQKFIDLLSDGDRRKAIEIKKAFEPEIMCDRKHVAGYDDAFRRGFSRRFSISSSHDVSGLNGYCEELGEGIDISNELNKLKEEKPEIFIAFARKDHWRAVIGKKEVDTFLAALPKSTDEKRNALTHNPYDRTTRFVEFVHDRGYLSLDKEGVELMTDFVARFGLARSQHLYRDFQILSQLEEDQKPPPQTFQGRYYQC